ncbi:hypothetical protein HHI36_001451 [Cryptolaemus montrouzieri]|uniref:Amino acid transporter n=1 Tax=Cryptolaemus montrouzieri TaxID=559131 RepID=A0ABD2P7U0_9CUCU
MAGFVRRNLLTLLTIVGVLGGAALGFLLRQVGSGSGQWDKRSVMYLAFPGEVFLRMLKCLIIPLLVTSVVTAIGSLDLSLSKKIAFRAIAYYSATTVCAVILGIILVTTIRPGVGLKPLDDDTDQPKMRHVTTQDTLLDLIR